MTRKGGKFLPRQAISALIHSRGTNLTEAKTSPKAKTPAKKAAATKQAQRRSEESRSNPQTPCGRQKGGEDPGKCNSCCRPNFLPSTANEDDRVLG
jgi:hypothetical protein